MSKKRSSTQTTIIPAHTGWRLAVYTERFTDVDGKRYPHWLHYSEVIAWDIIDDDLRFVLPITTDATIIGHDDQWALVRPDGVYIDGSDGIELGTERDALRSFAGWANYLRKKGISARGAG
jgi:hypothetical protein